MFTDIIWDFDGTLFDTYDTIVSTFMKALEDSGIQENDGEVLVWMRRSVASALDHYTEKHALGKAFLERYKYHRSMEDIAAVKPFPHAVEICRAVYGAGRRNYIYTHRGTTTYAYLDCRGLRGYFREILTRADGFPPKPDPGAILYLIEKHRIAKENAIMIGDRALDINAAKNAGIAGCFFDPDTPETNGIADYTIHTMDELAAIIEL